MTYKQIQGRGENVYKLFSFHGVFGTTSQKKSKLMYHMLALKIFQKHTY